MIFMKKRKMHSVGAMKGRFGIDIAWPCSGSRDILWKAALHG